MAPDCGRRGKRQPRRGARTEAPRRFGKNERDCEPVHICSVWRLLTALHWGFQGPSKRRRRDTEFRARRRNFSEAWFAFPGRP
jgi:hypothetical protein